MKVSVSLFSYRSCMDTLYIGARVVAGTMNICQKPSCVVAKNEHNGEENAEERVPFKNREHHKLEIQISDVHENN